MVIAIIRVVSLVCYLAAAIGTPWFAHFCGGEPVDNSPYIAVPGCCANNNDTDEKDGCCHNEASWLSTDEHSATGGIIIKLFTPAFSFLRPTLIAANDLSISDRPFTNLLDFWRPPPLVSGRGWLLAHHQLLN